MAFTPRNASAIKATLLADWSARYQANGRVLNTASGSEADLLSSALSVELEGLEAQAAANARNIFPDTADTDSLNHAGTVDQLPRESATAAVLTIAVTTSGLANGNYSVAGYTLTSPNGLTYAPTTTTITIASNAGTLDVQCTVAGANTNQPVGTILSWSSAPSSFNPTTTVTAIATPGRDQEQDKPYAARILARRQGHPGSGNRVDWQSWALGEPTGQTPSGVIVTSIGRAWVYPQLQPDAGGPSTGAGTPGVPGCVTAVVAPSPLTSISIFATGLTPSGLTPAFSPVSANDLTAVRAYIEGTGTNSVQLRPVTMALADYSVEAAQNPGGITVTIQVTPTSAAGAAFPFATALTTTNATTPTTTQFSVSSVGSDLTAALAAGPVNVAVQLGTGQVIGGHVLTQITGIVGNLVTVSPALPVAPGTGTTVRPAPQWWAAATFAVVNCFQRLGPMDSTAPSTRWPSAATQPYTLYVNQLVAALVPVYDTTGLTVLSGIAGIQNVVVSSPGSDTSPTGAKQSLYPANIAFTP